MNQARELADFYGRPFLELVLPTTPIIPIPEIVPDFRRHARTKTDETSWELRDLQVWAEATRINALDLFDEIGELVPQFPDSLFSSTDTDAEDAAVKTRALIGFSIQDQFRLTRDEANALPSILREQLEILGVLALRSPELKALGIRGICLAEFPLPVVIFGNESSTAQAFTIVHEFAHIILRESGITGSRDRSSYPQKTIEGWCDRFAAAFLMPEQQVVAIVGPIPKKPRESIEDEFLKLVASVFRVSPHAMLIRLVHLGYVDAVFYWDKKKHQFDEEERSLRSFGRAKYYGVRYRSRMGDLYTGLVLEAWATGRLTNHNAAEYMGIKNLDHLYDIRSHFGDK